MGADSNRFNRAIGRSAPAPSARRPGRADFAPRASFACRPCAALARPAFTIAELVVVLAIIALLAGMAVPRFGGMVARQRADQAAERVAAALCLARRHAVAESRTLAIDADADRDLLTLPGISDPDRPGTDLALRLADDPWHADLVYVDYGTKASLEFDAYGAAGSTVLFRIAVGDELRDVTVAAGTGTVTVSEPAGVPK